jgi:hypothetical protein
VLVGGRGAADSFESRWQYADFVAWQDQLATNGVLERHRRCWEPQLAGVEPLPLGRESGTSGHRTGVAVAPIDRHTVDALEQRARAAKTTLFTMLLTAFGLLTHYETGREGITVASLFANHMKPELRGTVGFIANPARQSVQPSRSPSCCCARTVSWSTHSFIRSTRSISYRRRSCSAARAASMILCSR